MVPEEDAARRASSGAANIAMSRLCHHILVHGFDWDICLAASTKVCTEALSVWANHDKRDTSRAGSEPYPPVLDATVSLGAST